jgi:hypothetical protein
MRGQRDFVALKRPQNCVKIYVLHRREPTYGHEAVLGLLKIQATKIETT